MRYSTPVLVALLLTLPSWAFAEALRIFTWRADTAATFPGTQQMVWVKAGVGQKSPDGTTVIRAVPAATAAKDAIRRLKAREPASRIVIIAYAGIATGPNGELPLFPGGDSAIEAYAKGGFTDFTRQWMAAFWRDVHAAGIKPALIVIDYESAVGFWGLKRNFKRDASISADMPDWAAGTVVAMRRLEEQLGFRPTPYAPIDFVREGKSWKWNSKAVAAFNAWFAPRRAAALRNAIFEPVWNEYSERIPAANYNEQEREWPGIDPNGWQTDPEPTSGNWSSPNTYLTMLGSRHRVQLAKTQPQAVRAIEWTDRRNDVLSALAKSWNVAPWYSNPDYGCDESCDRPTHRLRWAAGLLHDRAIGVNTMLFWSEHAWTESEVRFARPIMDHILNRPSPDLVAITKMGEPDAQEELDRWIDAARTVIETRPSTAAIP